METTSPAVRRMTACRWRHAPASRSALLRGVALLVALAALLPLAPARAAGAIVLAGGAPGSLYITSADGRSVQFVRRDGTVMATRRLDGPAGALALDPRRDVLYVALASSAHILVLDGATLRSTLTLSAPLGASGLAAVPGQPALYLFDPATRRTLYLTYDASGNDHLTAVFSAITPAKEPRVHLSLEPARAGRERVVFWANGFAPGETVAVSWGASAQSSPNADRYGIVSGAFTVAAPLPAGPHGLALYGLASHRILTEIVTTGARARRHTHARPAAPPLYLGLLPGPVATVTPPVLRQAIRVPMAAGALPAMPLTALAGLFVSRRRKKRRAAAKRAAPRRPMRR